MNALADPAIVDLLRDILAMHWARSPATKAVHEQVGHDVFQESRLKYARDPELLGRVFRWRTGGLYPAGVSSLLWANDELHRLPPEVLEQWFAERNAAHYQEARDHFANLQVQIGYADGADFLIGDVPVVTRKPGHPGLGPHQDVALKDANTVSMPLSPNIIIALANEPAIERLSAEHVAHFNQMQTKSFIRFIGCRPGGPSDKQLQQAALRSNKFFNP